jgi:hypothetical protein
MWLMARVNASLADSCSPLRVTTSALDATVLHTQTRRHAGTQTQTQTQPQPDTQTHNRSGEKQEETNTENTENADETHSKRYRGCKLVAHHVTTEGLAAQAVREAVILMCTRRRLSDSRATVSSKSSFSSSRAALAPLTLAMMSSSAEWPSSPWIDSSGNRCSLYRVLASLCFFGGGGVGVQHSRAQTHTYEWVD